MVIEEALAGHASRSLQLSSFSSLNRSRPGCV